VSIKLQGFFFSHSLPTMALFSWDPHEQVCCYTNDDLAKRLAWQVNPNLCLRRVSSLSVCFVLDRYSNGMDITACRRRDNLCHHRNDIHDETLRTSSGWNCTFVMLVTLFSNSYSLGKIEEDVLFLQRIFTSSGVHTSSYSRKQLQAHNLSYW
jgi:hypothetical protein